MKTEKRFFTLVELIAAIAVMGFVMLIIGTASVSFYNTWNISARQTGILREYRNIDIVMDTLVRNMIPFNWTDTENNKTDSDLLFSGEREKMMFSALRRSYRGDGGGLIFVRLRFEDGKLLADYSQYPRFPWLANDDPDMPWETEELASGLRSISFLYADRTDNGTVEWLEEWDREAKKVPPLAVRMTLTRKDGTEESWLRRTAASSANSVFGDRMEVKPRDASSTSSSR